MRALRLSRWRCQSSPSDRGLDMCIHICKVSWTCSDTGDDIPQDPALCNQQHQWCPWFTRNWKVGRLIYTRRVPLGQMQVCMDSHFIYSDINCRLSPFSDFRDSYPWFTIHDSSNYDGIIQILSIKMSMLKTDPIQSASPTSNGFFKSKRSKSGGRW
jgi:hypothetical protein